MAAQVSDWFERWSEPAAHRLRSRRPALDQFNRNAAWFGIATSPFLRDWYRPLSEPVRSKAPLPRGASPYLFETISYIQYALAVTETGDTWSLSMIAYPPKNLARVAITEIETYPTQVTIREVRYDRRYS